ncbi:MAG: DUF3291 domain-containing protein [Saprospiraceae bacterium]
MNQQIVTLTFFRYTDFGAQFWAFGMMQFAHADLSKTKGLTFYKLMGSGKNAGFNPLPDWSTYALLQVWEDEAAANDFFQQSPLIQRYDQQSTERWTIYMRTIMARGEWSQQQPFAVSDNLSNEVPLLGVITRATIKWRQLYNFWKYVPTSHQKLLTNSGLIYTKGIGEVPALQMATFSLWKDAAALKKFAYEQKEHRVAIEKTRQLDWYKEELFARFQPYRSEGTWQGEQPLAAYL